VSQGVTGLFYAIAAGATSINDADAIFEGRDYDLMIAGAEVGDLDGDGENDLMTGGLQDEGLGTPYGPGVARLFVGTPMGEYGPDDAHAELNGEEDGDEFGRNLTGVGDADGDGQDDVLIGALAPDGVDPGQVYVVHGPLEGYVALDSRSITRIDGQYGARIGHSLTRMGDLDRDGTGDFAMGVLGSPDGGAYVFLGPW
jgi:hypothetical protein